MATTPANTVLRHIRTLAAADDAPLSDRQHLERFATGRDGDAFAALVRRHGAMVLGVCRRVLRHSQDAEDAFQATFLLLARKADSLRHVQSLGGWLHQVAYHLALRARAHAARRRPEPREADMPTDDPLAELTWRELRVVLDEELNRLPEQPRAAVVLCHLEGKTHAEAARQLGWSVGTLRRRLGQGRELLRERLVRRGLTFSAALVTVLAAEGGAGACVPAVLQTATAKAALGVAAGQAVRGVSSGPIATLVEEGITAMFVTKLKTATALLLALAVTLAASVWAHRSFAARQSDTSSARVETPDEKQAARPTPPARDDEKAETVEVSGRVLTSDGKPAVGARVTFVRQIVRQREFAPAAPAPQATTDRDGRFRFRVPKGGHENQDEKTYWFNVTITAVLAGHGPGLTTVSKPEALKNLTVQLVKDDVPIQGRVLDLEGRPIKGVRVRVLEFAASEREDLKLWVEDLKHKKAKYGIHRPRGEVDAAAVGLTGSVVTSADGRFELTGVGRERLVSLRVEGPTIETRDFHAMTRPGTRIEVPVDQDEPRFGNEVFFGAKFDYAAAPTRPIIGTVTDKKTGKPIAGVTLEARFPTALPSEQHRYLRTRTDKEGRYRLVGLSREDQYLYAVPAPGQTYLPAGRKSSAGPGLAQATADFELLPGVLIKGKVTDKGTGKPLARSEVNYFVFSDNPALKELPSLRAASHVRTHSGADGSFTLVGLSGRGLIAAKGPGGENGLYISGASAARKIKGSDDHDHFRTYPYICNARLQHAVVEVNPGQETVSITCNVTLDPGKTVSGTLVDPDGKPITGVDVHGTWGMTYHTHNLPSEKFSVPGIDPDDPRPYFFEHRGKRLAAAVILKGNEAKDFTVRLQKCGTITGRLVDVDDNPLPGRQLAGSFEDGQLNVPRGWAGFFSCVTDKDGRFRAEGLIPGVRLGAHVQKGGSLVGRPFRDVTLKPGETRDLGDITVKITP